MLEFQKQANKAFETLDKLASTQSTFDKSAALLCKSADFNDEDTAFIKECARHFESYTSLNTEELIKLALRRFAKDRDADKIIAGIRKESSDESVLLNAAYNLIDTVGTDPEDFALFGEFQKRARLGQYARRAKTLLGNAGGKVKGFFKNPRNALHMEPSPVPGGPTYNLLPPEPGSIPKGIGGNFFGGGRAPNVPNQPKFGPLGHTALGVGLGGAGVLGSQYAAGHVDDFLRNAASRYLGLDPNHTPSSGGSGGGAGNMSSFYKQLLPIIASKGNTDLALAIMMQLAGEGQNTEELMPYLTQAMDYRQNPWQRSSGLF